MANSTKDVSELSTVPESNDQIGENTNADEERDGESVGEDNQGNDNTLDEHGDMEVDNDEEEQWELEDQNNELVDSRTQSSRDNETTETSQEGAAPAAEAGTVTADAGSEGSGVAATSIPSYTSIGPDIELQVTHPLIGMWEGSFNVKIPSGKYTACFTFCGCSKLHF